MICMPRERDGRLLLSCALCDTLFVLHVNMLDLMEFIQGNGYIQDLFPYLTANERELLQSKVCGACFDSHTKVPYRAKGEQS